MITLLRIVLCTAFLPAVLVAFSAQPTLAATVESLKMGKEAFTAECMKCHDTIEEAAGGERERGTWEEIVTEMVSMGAALEGERKEAVVGFLTARSLVMGKCGMCHSVQRPFTKNKTHDEWKATVERMAGKFKGHISAEEAEQVAAFLAVERPAK
jgi:cytochrome c2